MRLIPPLIYYHLCDFTLFVFDVRWHCKCEYQKGLKRAIWAYIYMAVRFAFTIFTSFARLGLGNLKSFKNAMKDVL